LWLILCHVVAMQTMNLRQLRDTRQLKDWLRAGETVELRERNTVLGRIVPERRVAGKVERPDFAARRRAIFGDRRIDAVDILIEERNGRY
jgi:antitoxin (DNA-binding transcriptional repressor) of toxin-antitoxin stability system